MVKSRSTRRMIAFIVTFVMIFASMPAHAFATEDYDYNVYENAGLNGDYAYDNDADKDYEYEKELGYGAIAAFGAGTVDLHFWMPQPDGYLNGVQTPHTVSFWDEPDTSTIADLGVTVVPPPGYCFVTWAKSYVPMVILDPNPVIVLTPTQQPVRIAVGGAGTGSVTIHDVYRYFGNQGTWVELTPGLSSATIIHGGQTLTINVVETGGEYGIYISGQLPNQIVFVITFMRDGVPVDLAVQIGNQPVQLPPPPPEPVPIANDEPIGPSPTGTWHLVPIFALTPVTLTYTVTDDPVHGAPATFTPALPIPNPANVEPGANVTVLDNLTTTETTNAAGLLGTWTFTGWTAPANVNVISGEFIMPQENVTFTGYWTFQLADARNVTYTVTGVAPATFDPDPVSTLNHTAQPGATVQVAAIPTTTEATNAAGLIGTWTFNGWTAPAGVTVTAGEFTMPNADVAFTGTWSFQLADARNVTYTVTGVAPATFDPDPISSLNHTAQPGASVTVAAIPTTTEATNAAGLLGTWTFNGWTAPTGVTVTDGAFAMPNADVAFTGTWTFQLADARNVTYTVTGVAPATFDPDPISGLNHTAQPGATVTVADIPTTTETTNAAGLIGTWTFNGWTAPAGVTVTDGAFAMPNADVAFTGTWTFTLAGEQTLTYTVTDDPVHGAPATSTPAVPEPMQVAPGADVTVLANLTTTETTNAAGLIGTWAFTPWSSVQVPAAVAGETFSMPDEDVIFAGTWTFTPNIAWQVMYAVDPDPIHGVPAAALTSDIPASVSVQHGATVTVANVMTTTATANAAGLAGTWTFTGWTAPAGVIITDGAFTMPNNDVWLQGEWTFAPHGELIIDNLPDKDPLPVDQTPSQPLAPGAELPDLYEGAAPGWTFLGWTTTTANILYDGTMTWQYALDAGYVTAPPANMPLNGDSVTVTAVWGNDDGYIGVPNSMLIIENLPEKDPLPTGQTESQPLAPGAELPDLFEGIAAGWTFLGWTTTTEGILTDGTMTWAQAVAAGLITAPPTYMPTTGYDLTVTAVWGNYEGYIGVPNTGLIVDNLPAKNPLPVGQTPSQPLAPGAELLDMLYEGVAIGWTFLGWTTTIAGIVTDGTMTWTQAEAAGLITTPPDYMPDDVDSVKVYAVWGDADGYIGIPNKVTVTFDANTGTFPAAELPLPVTRTVRAGEDLTTNSMDASMPAPPTRANHTFAGWFTVPAATGGEQFTATTAVYEDITVYARWTPAPPPGNGGGGPGPQQPVITPPEVPQAPFIADHVWFVRGYPDGSFRPGQSITRAEVSMILWRLLDSEAKFAERTNDFSDVNNGWYARAVSYLAFRGIVAGYPDGTFRPNAPITRAELVTMMSRFWDLDDSGTNNFSDVADTHWAIAYIINASAKGWVEGFPDGTFRPGNATSRAEAVTVINRVLERVANPTTINYHLNGYVYERLDTNRLFNDITNAHWAFYNIMEAAIEHEFELDAQGREIWTEVSIPWLDFDTPRL